MSGCWLWIQAIKGLGRPSGVCGVTCGGSHDVAGVHGIAPTRQPGDWHCALVSPYENETSAVCDKLGPVGTDGKTVA